MLCAVACHTFPCIHSTYSSVLLLLCEKTKNTKIHRDGWRKCPKELRNLSFVDEKTRVYYIQLPTNAECFSLAQTQKKKKIVFDVTIRTMKGGNCYVIIWRKKTNALIAGMNGKLVDHIFACLFSAFCSVVRVCGIFFSFCSFLCIFSIGCCENCRIQREGYGSSTKPAVYITDYLSIRGIKMDCVNAIGDRVRRQWQLAAREHQQHPLNVCVRKLYCSPIK